MVKITKVYTKTGDKGETGLIGGNRVPKNNARIEAFGTVDELMASIGLVRCFLARKPAAHPDEVRHQKFDLILETIQHKLFDLGAELATLPGTEYPGQIKASENDVVWLEEVIDAMNEELTPLNSFVLPGGTEVNAFLHQARTICRRAERRVIDLQQEEAVGAFVIPFLNRLSDALFVFGRWVSSKLGEEETLWVPGKSIPDWNWK